MFGKKNHLIDVIKYEGPADVFVWKHECEDFNTKSQLIVHESQEAILFKNGQALSSFPAGRYTLDTQNIPLLDKVTALPTGGVTPFHCEVYFVNKAVSMGMQWGTDSPIELEDPDYEFPISITSFGDFSLRVNDARRLLVKLVGTVSKLTHEQINQYFVGIMTAHIRECISSTMIDNKIGALKVNTKLVFISQELKGQLTPVFDEYGLSLNHFAVNSIKARGLEELGKVLKQVKIDTIAASGQTAIEHMKIGVDAERIEVVGSAQNTVKLGEGSVHAQLNKLKGITEQQKRAFEVAEKLAGNEGPIGTIATGPALMGVGGVLQSPAGMSSKIVATAMGQTGKPDAPAAAPDEARAEDVSAFERRIDKLKMLYDRGMISDAVYTAKVDEIVRGI